MPTSSIDRLPNSDTGALLIFCFLGMINILQHSVSKIAHVDVRANTHPGRVTNGGFVDGDVVA